MRAPLFAVVLSGIVALCATAPASAQVFRPFTAQLDNGMRVVVISNHRAPVVTHMLWIGAGAMDDPWGVSGIAHFLEHLIFKGTPTYPEGEYSRIINRHGGQENAFTAQDYTAYYVTIGKRHLETVMRLEADRMAHWRVTDEQVARERDVILKERQQRIENNPIAHFFEQVNGVLYVNHPYQRPVIGWRDEMEKLDRKAAEDFVRAHYVPNNMMLVVSGDVTPDEVMTLAKKHYAGLSRGTSAARPQQNAVGPQSPQRLQATSPLVRQSVWSRHRLVPPARPQTIAQSDALLVLDKILGDGRIGRLYRRLVVRDGIATSASTSYGGISLGDARFSISVAPQPDVTAAQIERAVDDEIRILLDQGVTEDDVRMATRALEIEAVYARDSVSGPALTLGTALMSGLDVETVESWPARMRAVTRDVVNQAARQLFTPDIAWVTAVLDPEEAP